MHRPKVALQRTAFIPIGQSGIAATVINTWLGLPLRMSAILVVEDEPS